MAMDRILSERLGHDFFRDLRFRGTFAPAFRAWESPIAIACLRLLTFLPDRPLLSVPALRSCIARFTFFWAVFPYFAIWLLCELTMSLFRARRFRLRQFSRERGRHSDNVTCMKDILA